MKQIVEFKYVKDNTEAMIASEAGLVEKNVFIVTKEEGHLWFNGINLSNKDIPVTK